MLDAGREIEASAEIPCEKSLLTGEQRAQACEISSISSKTVIVLLGN
jgi:hypothetical protein